jgi:protein-S-isoprenylcysteine O-methyltransferase Ste14
MKRKKFDVALEVTLAITMLGQILATIFLSSSPGIAALHLAGFIILLISAVFGWLPIFTLKKHGKTEEGKSYIHTTELVDRGIYGVVRHPQYLAGILVCIGLALIAQSLLSIVLGVVSAGIFIYSIGAEDKSNREKLGTAYEEYAKRVPRVNFIVGMGRKIRS